MRAGEAGDGAATLVAVRDPAPRGLLVTLLLVVALGVGAVQLGLSYLSGSSPFGAAAARPTASPGSSPSPSPSSDVLAETSEPAPTPDTEAPVIAAHSPAGGATAVAPGSVITIDFSEPVRKVSGATIQLVNVAGGWVVKASVSYDAARHRAVLDPNLWMYPKTQYRVSILKGIVDGAGNALAPASWTFTTSP